MYLTPDNFYLDVRGQTELAGGATGMSRAYGGLRLGSCNQVVPNTRLQVRHTETDQPLGAGEVGELVIRGPQVMLGYRNNPEANRLTFDDSGWMRTGDIGYYDTEGFLYIVDRMKELIKVKGLQESSPSPPHYPHYLCTAGCTSRVGGRVARSPRSPGCCSHWCSQHQRGRGRASQGLHRQVRPGPLRGDRPAVHGGAGGSTQTAGGRPPVCRGNPEVCCGQNIKERFEGQIQRGHSLVIQLAVTALQRNCIMGYGMALDIYHHFIHGLISRLLLLTCIM